LLETNATTFFEAAMHVQIEKFSREDDGF